MTSNHRRFVERTVVTAVRSALTALAFVPAVYAADGSDDAVLELTQPANQVQIGAGYVDKDSAKFGEFNGLDQKGAYAIGDFELYGSGEKDSAYRWRLLGTDLGLDTRNIQGEAGSQGRFRVTFGYDELNGISPTATRRCGRAPAAPPSRCPPAILRPPRVLPSPGAASSPTGTTSRRPTPSREPAGGGPGVRHPRQHAQLRHRHGTHARQRRP